MTDVFPPEKRREIMSKIRGKNTKPELEIKEILDSLGIEYVYQARLDLGGKRRTVDFLIPDKRIVIEYRDCFWHWCPRCYGDNVPVKGGILGRKWWENKLRKNRERDRELEELLRKHGYRLVVVWGHDRRNMKDIIMRALG